MNQTLEQIKVAEQQRKENTKVQRLLKSMCAEFERLHVLWPEGVQEWWRAHHNEGHA